MDPNSPEYHFMKAVVLEHLGRYEDALEEFDKAIKLSPKIQNITIGRLGY